MARIISDSSADAASIFAIAAPRLVYDVAGISMLDDIVNSLYALLDDRRANAQAAYLGWIEQA
jgi:hypothetical protein